MKGKVDIILDSAHGSSGKGKLSAWLADSYGCRYLSSANSVNAGHSAVIASADGAPPLKFVAKALPTAAILNAVEPDYPRECFITPGSGFSWPQFVKEWEQCGQPLVWVHDRACIVTEQHAARERSGAESTAHIASTMQGSATAMCDKIMRKKNAPLAAYHPVPFEHMLERVQILSGAAFRDKIHAVLDRGDGILHEGSQGYALSIDHGNAFPFCTSRNCSSAAALDYLGVAPQRLGDVWLNLRTYPIRVGSIAEGYSGDFYPDSTEITWEEVARRAGMPPEEAAALAERERTTVTKRIRRVATFSFENLHDAVRTNGATKLCLNFASYLNWADNGVKELDKLSAVTRAFMDKIESAVNVPIVLVGTGAEHSEMVVRDDYL